MGLDMYLTAYYYISVYNGEEIIVNGLEIPKGTRLTQVGIEIGYWRKANAIHAWFVDNVQEGIDECQTSWVDQGEIENLLTLCKTVINSMKFEEIEKPIGNHDSDIAPITKKEKTILDYGLARELLPTRSGFFFGDTLYDYYYYEQLEYTVKVCETALNLSDGWAIQYHSSW